MSAAYPLAAHPEPYQILGLRLRPFSLGHCEHMERHGVVFALAEPGEPTMADLLLAVFICSQTYESFAETLEQSDWLKDVEAWGRKCGSFDFFEKAKLFLEYIKAGSVQPMVVFEGDSKPTGSHWIQCVKIALMDAGYSETRVMNMPLSQAFSDYYKHAENKGVVRIVPADQAAMFEALDAATAEAAP